MKHLFTEFKTFFNTIQQERLKCLHANYRLKGRRWVAQHIKEGEANNNLLEVLESLIIEIDEFADDTELNKSIAAGARDFYNFTIGRNKEVEK